MKSNSLFLCTFAPMLVTSGCGVPDRLVNVAEPDGSQADDAASNGNVNPVIVRMPGGSGGAAGALATDTTGSGSGGLGGASTGALRRSSARRGEAARPARS